MFFFGDSSETAQLYWTSALNLEGPAIPDVFYDEMSEKQLRNTLTYLRIAYLQAVQDGAGDEILALLLDEYDLVFEHLAEVSDDFRKAVLTGLHQPITGFDDESFAKYRSLAGVA